MKNKKTAPDVATIESSKGQKFSGRAEEIPLIDFITIPHEAQAVERLLRNGERNAIPSQKLLEATGISSVRQLREQVARERAAGALILSSEKGYFLPTPGEDGRQEMRRFISTIYSKALSTIKAAETARKALNVVDGQIPLP